MLRSLYIVKRSPSVPTRSWRKKAGRGEVTRTTMASASSSGAATSRATRAAVRSTVFLTNRRTPLNSGSSTCSRGRPETGRMWMRGPATSVSDGATTRSTPEPSSCHDSRRRSDWLRSDHAPTATVSAPVSRSAATMLVDVPTTGTPSTSGPCGAVDARADDREAGLRLTAELPDELGAGALASDDDDLVQAQAAGAQPVQALARDVAEQQREQHGRRQRDQDVQPGGLEPQGEADDRGQRRAGGRRR